MKKSLLLSALLLSSVAVSHAQTASETTPNAVCLTLTSGQAEYVAFTTHPQITTADGQLIVSDAESNATALSKSLADIASITAVYHNFTDPTGITSLSQETGKTVESIYDLQGRTVTTVQPGKVYILKYSDGSTKKAIQ